MLGILDIRGLLKAIKNNPTVFLTLIALLGFGMYHLFNAFVIPAKNREIRRLEKENLELKIHLKNLETKKDIQEQLNEKVRETREDIRTLLQILIDKLERGSDCWQAYRFPSRQVVKDLEGYYFVIDIQDAYSREIIKFRTGEYIIDDFNQRFIKSLNYFYNQIIREIPRDIPYRIFIKGSADILGDQTFQRKFDPVYRYDKITVYKKASGWSKYKYIQKYKTDNIREPIWNRHLPNLRARFLQERLMDTWGELKDAPILDGDVEPQLGQEYRNAMLLLFIKFPGQT